MWEDGRRVGDCEKDGRSVGDCGRMEEVWVIVGGWKEGG